MIDPIQPTRLPVCTHTSRKCLSDEESDKMCDDESDAGYVCTRSAGHEGPHVACGNDTHNLDVWAQ